MLECSSLLGSDELEIVRNRVIDLLPLTTILDNCYAHELDKEHRDDDYTDSQHRARRSENVNMLARNCWIQEQQGHNPWQVVDERYMHLSDSVTGLYMQLHPVNPLTGGVAKPAETIRSHGRYLQSGCRSADKLQTLREYDGVVVPDLSDVSLQALWKINQGVMSVTIYKPLNAKKGTFCIEIPLFGDDEQQEALRFEAISDNDNVLVELISENQDMASENYA